MEERREGEGSQCKEGRLSSDLALAFDDVGAAEGPAEGWEGEERRGADSSAVVACAAELLLALPQITHSFCPSNFPKGHFTCLTLNVSSHYYSNSSV